MIKGYPCHGTGQPIAAALHELKSRSQIDVASVRRVHIRTNDAHHMLSPRFLDPEPTNHLGAQCSIPYTTAVALVRDLHDPLQFDESVLVDEQIRRIARLVTWEAIGDGTGKPLHVELDVTTADGTLTVTGGPYRGSVDNLASFGDVVDKFHRYSRHVLDEPSCAKAVELVRGLEHVEDAAELAELVAAR
jgi:2-methylcitrate dehydratase PrpD